MWLQALRKVCKDVAVSTRHIPDNGEGKAKISFHFHLNGLIDLLRRPVIHSLLGPQSAVLVMEHRLICWTIRQDPDLAFMLAVEIKFPKTPDSLCHSLAHGLPSFGHSSAPIVLSAGTN